MEVQGEGFRVRFIVERYVIETDKWVDIEMPAVQRPENLKGLLTPLCRNFMREAVNHVKDKLDGFYAGTRHAKTQDIVGQSPE